MAKPCLPLPCPVHLRVLVSLLGASDRVSTAKDSAWPPWSAKSFSPTPANSANWSARGSVSGSTGFTLLPSRRQGFGIIDGWQPQRAPVVVIHRKGPLDLAGLPNPARPWALRRLPTRLLTRLTPACRVNEILIPRITLESRLPCLSPGRRTTGVRGVGVSDSRGACLQASSGGVLGLPLGDLTLTSLRPSRLRSAGETSPEPPGRNTFWI